MHLWFNSSGENGGEPCLSHAEKFLTGAMGVGGDSGDKKGSADEGLKARGACGLGHSRKQEVEPGGVKKTWWIRLKKRAKWKKR